MFILYAYFLSNSSLLSLFPMHSSLLRLFPMHSQKKKNSNFLSNHIVFSGINNLIQAQTINIWRYHNTLKNISKFG